MTLSVIRLFGFGFELEVEIPEFFHFETVLLVFGVVERFEFVYGELVELVKIVPPFVTAPELCV